MPETLSRKVQEMLSRGVKERVFPGGVVAVWHEGRFFLEAFGWQEFFPRPCKATPNTYYDLASLTKPLATTLCLMRLIAEGHLDLDRNLADFFLVPYWLARISLRELLSHSAGFPAHRPYFIKLLTYPLEERPKILETWILKEPLAYPPGKKHLYSDLGFFLLGRIVEKCTRRPLAEYFSETLALLELPREGLLFRPLRCIPADLLAATEVCPWRGKLLKGEVHDENAWAVGGVAGHAGLFGTGEMVLQLLVELLMAYRGEKERAFLSRPLLREFWDWQSPCGETWALGFDRPSPRGSSAGEKFSPKALGHLGFTGTSFWLDPEKRLVVVFLTNRIHPHREPNKIKAFRPAFHNLLLKELGL